MLVGFDRIETGEHHWLGLLESGQRFVRQVALVTDRVADAGLGDVLDICNHPADLARRECLAGDRLWRAESKFLDIVRPAS